MEDLKDKVKKIFEKNVVKLAEGIVEFDTIIGIKNDVLNDLIDEIITLYKEQIILHNTNITKKE